MKLVVKEPFDGYEKGTLIEEEETIKAILESDNAGHVLKVEG